MDHSVAPVANRVGGKVTWLKSQWKLSADPAQFRVEINSEGKLDVAFVLGVVDPRDCHSRRLWEEPFMIALPLDHPLAYDQPVAWPDLSAELFLVRHDGAGPQLQDQVVRRVSESGHAARIRRCDVGRDTLMYMVAIGEGITLTTASASHLPFPGVVFRTLADEPEPARFSAVWSPHNRSPALKNLLVLADAMIRSAQPSESAHPDFRIP